jgi:hypothetical protein
VISDNSVWLLGNGANISFWLDNWCGDPLVEQLGIPIHIRHLLSASVSDFISNGQWHIPTQLSLSCSATCIQLFLMFLFPWSLLKTNSFGSIRIQVTWSSSKHIFSKFSKCKSYIRPNRFGMLIFLPQSLS